MLLFDNGVAVAGVIEEDVLANMLALPLSRLTFYEKLNVVQRVWPTPALP